MQCPRSQQKHPREEEVEVEEGEREVQQGELQQGLLVVRARQHLGPCPQSMRRPPNQVLVLAQVVVQIQVVVVVVVVQELWSHQWRQRHLKVCPRVHLRRWWEEVLVLAWVLVLVLVLVLERL